MKFTRPLLFGALLAIVPAAYMLAQTPNAADIKKLTEQDHQNMMDQLGIKALRPGPSGDEKRPDHAN
jgi:hypothetical protein